MNSPRWTDPNLTIPDDEKACFQGNPERFHLEERTEIYRMRTNREGKDVVGSKIWESAWWFPKSTYERIVTRAQTSGKSVTVAARSGLGVPRRFNTDFDTLVIMRLSRSGFAYKGAAAPQKWSETFKVRLPGGFEQWWIPGLQQLDLRYKYFGSVG